MLPSQIDGYRIVRELGSGGMGTVYEASHVEHGQRVAIKVVHPDHVRDPEIEQRFLNEAQALARITHPSIVQLHSFGVLPDGTSYLVMEFLSGETLAQRWQRLREPNLFVELRLLHPIVEVLALLHRAGVVHRDLKPDNIMIVADATTPEQERAKLVDFGLAKLARISGQRSSSGLIMGTPAYMSPEQCRGAGLVDARTDCYALGVLLYELVAGRKPFDSQWAGDLIGMHLHVEPEPLERRVPNVDAKLAAFISALLQKNKENRPPMAEVAEHLGELLLQLEQFGTAPLASWSEGNDAFAPTLLHPALEDSQRTEPDSAPEILREELARLRAPSQPELDALFAAATQARILEGGIQHGEPIGKRALLTLKSAELPALQRALLIKDQSPSQRCTCLGDLTIELHGASGRLALFAYHYHDVALLGNADWDRDLQVVKADALLLFLGRHGITAPGRRLFTDAAMKREVRKQQQALRGESAALPIEEQPEKRAVFDGKLLITRVTDGQTAVELDWAIDFLSTQQTLTTRGSLLARISDRRWERLIAHARTRGLVAKLPYLEHAERVGQALRSPLWQPPREKGAQIVKLAPSRHGPLSKLVTDGVDLYAVAEQQLVRVTPGDGQMSTVMKLPAPDCELSGCGASLLFTSRSLGVVGRIHVGEARSEILARGRTSPHRPTHCGWRPHWLEAPVAAARRAALLQLRRGDYAIDTAVELARIGDGSPGLLGDDEFLYVLDQLPDGKTQLKWFAQDGRPFESVKPSPRVEPHEGLSRLEQNATHLYWPTADRILSTRKLRLESNLRAIASGPIAGIAATENGVFALIGRAADTLWHVELAATSDTATTRIGSFERREADLVAAVTLGETLYFTCGDSIYFARAG